MPFAIDAFRTVSARHPAPDAPPDKMHRRMVGQQGHGVDGLGACEKPRRAWPGCRPPDLSRIGHRRDAGNRTLRNIALSRGAPKEPPLPSPVPEQVDGGRDAGDRGLAATGTPEDRKSAV